ncbi:vWA domain-containing protein [Flindersiella endophytica]
MRFESPVWLWLLVVAAGLVVAYLVMQRRRSRYAVRFATLPMLAKVAPKRPGWRRHLPAAAFLAALVVLTLAIARPVADVRVPRERATVIVALDVSVSMEATDVAPDRARVAKEAAAAFIENLPDQFNVGLVTFAGSATVASSPSRDHQAGIAAVRGAELSGGTAIGEAVFAGLDAVSRVDAQAQAGEDPPPARIVLLSDGHNTMGRSPTAAAEAATEAGVPVSTIAYGTQDGTIEIDGQQVPVPVDADALGRLAQNTGGRSYTAETDTELRGVYDDLESSIGWTVEERDITTLVAGVSLAVALLAGIGSLLWFSRLP